MTLDSTHFRKTATILALCIHTYALCGSESNMHGSLDPLRYLI